MKPDSGKDSIFSSDKPKNLPWFYFIIILTILGMIFTFKWFN